MVRASGKSRVVQRPALLRDPDRLATHLEHECLGHGSQRVGCRHSEAGTGEPAQVIGGAREGHRWMERQRQGADAGGRAQHINAVPTARMGDQLAATYRLGGHQAVD